LLPLSPCQCGTLKRKLILIRREKNDETEKSSEKTAQRQAIWRQGKKANKVQIQSLVTDRSKKIIKVNSFKKVVLMHVWLSGIKTLLGTNLYFWPGPSTLIRDKVTISAGSRHVLWYLKMVFSVLNLNNGFFFASWTPHSDCHETSWLPTDNILLPW
jgi:hypothetical protein